MPTSKLSLDAGTFRCCMAWHDTVGDSKGLRTPQDGAFLSVLLYVQPSLWRFSRKNSAPVSSGVSNDRTNRLLLSLSVFLR